MRGAERSAIAPATRGLAGLALTALVAMTSPAAAQTLGLPSRVRIDVLCSAAVDRDQLIATLAIELAGTRWIVAGSGGHDIAVTVDAEPCVPSAAIRLQIVPGRIDAAPIDDNADGVPIRKRNAVARMDDNPYGIPNAVAPVDDNPYGKPNTVAPIDRNPYGKPNAVALTDDNPYGIPNAVAPTGDPANGRPHLRLPLDDNPYGNPAVIGPTTIGPIDLPPSVRTRALALLIAEALPGPTGLGTLAAASTRISPPGMLPSRFDLIARASGGPAWGTDLALTAIRRWYLFNPDQVATGARFTVGHAVMRPWLHFALDLGADAVETPFHYEMFAARAGFQLALRFAPTRQLAIELGGRGELAGAYANPSSDYTVTSPWLSTSSAGGLIAATLDVSPSFSARVELEVSGILHADDVELTYAPMRAGGVYPYMQSTFSSSVALSLGLTIR